MKMKSQEGNCICFYHGLLSERVDLCKNCQTLDNRKYLLRPRASFNNPHCFYERIQDGSGKSGWPLTSFGVAFTRLLRARQGVPTIKSGLSLAQSLGVVSTPYRPAIKIPFASPVLIARSLPLPRRQVPAPFLGTTRTEARDALITPLPCFLLHVP
jgi:hypothetical protein